MSKSISLPNNLVEQCGCMAVRHKFRTSCKACAWIACDQYLLNVCLKCNQQLHMPMSAEDAALAGCDENTINAYKMLDKLLQFDKENAQRTHVHDAQADYYETGTWLTEEEKSDIDRREKLRLEAKNSRVRRKVNINFDIAGRRVVDFVDEEEDASAGKGDSNITICSPFADSDGRPSWMYNEDGAQYAGTSSVYAQAVKSNLEGQVEGEKGEDTTPAPSLEALDVTIPVFENIELERNRGRAAEVYRSMKKRCVLYVQ